MPIVISPPFQPGSYERILTTCGGTPIRAFVEIGLQITRRFFAQQAILPPSDAYVASLWEGIWATSLSEGPPAPLADNAIGEPRTLDDNYLLSLTESTLARLPRHRAEDTLRGLCFQVFITLLSPEFRTCRQSYQKDDATGVCPRQTVDHCRDRISGAHCEDCPFFVALSREQHRKLLGRSFGESRQADWQAHTDLFLPEDFRALRIFWHLHLRQPRS